MAELVEGLFGEVERSRNRLRSLGDTHDRRILAARMAPSERVAHFDDVEWVLGNERHGRSTGDAGPRRDVADMTAHHLDNHDTVVDSAVVCSRPIASVAMSTAVANPKVLSVPPMSLSIVLGTPSTGNPSLYISFVQLRVPSPPMTMSASMPFASSVARTLSSPSSVRTD